MPSVHFFQTGSILFIKDYQFIDGSYSDKLLIVLCSDDKKNSIIFSLTTSKARIPQSLENHGCKNIYDMDISAYVFESGKVVGNKGNNSEPFSFDLNTFIFFRENVVEVSITGFDRYIASNKLFYLGRLYSKELRELLECILKSSFVNRGIKSKILKYLKPNDLDY